MSSLSVCLAQHQICSAAQLLRQSLHAIGFPFFADPFLKLVNGSLLFILPGMQNRMTEFCAYFR